MGKYTATSAARRHRNNATGKTEVKLLGEYLTEVPKDDAQFAVQSFLYGADPTGIYHSFLDTRDLMNYWSDYLYNTGQSWSDIKYPTMMMGYGSFGRTASTTFRFSKNIMRLYR